MLGRLTGLYSSFSRLCSHGENISRLEAIWRKGGGTKVVFQIKDESKKPSRLYFFSPKNFCLNPSPYLISGNHKQTIKNGFCLWIQDIVESVKASKRFGKSSIFCYRWTNFCKQLLVENTSGIT